MKAETLQKTLSALGLCRRAGKALLGTEIVCEALRAQKGVCLVVVPEDNSGNTRKKLTDKCAFYRVRLLELPIGGEDLAHAVGRTGHCAAVGVTDQHFLDLIQQTLHEEA